MSDQFPGPWEEGRMRFISVEGQIICVLDVNGRRVVGIGQDVVPAIEDCFKTLMGVNELELPLPTLLGLPRREDIPEWPRQPFNDAIND